LEGADTSLIIVLQNLSKLFTSYSHHCPSRPASGLRLEIASNIDKKKPEFYFPSAFKKILTEKPKRRWRGNQNDLIRERLTELAQSRIFLPFDRTLRRSASKK
jgi:hypothetical protein